MEFGKPLKMELHCHNSYSNYQLKDSRFTRDCETDVAAQLYAAKNAGLDAFFITNHNTLDGYRQLLEFQKDHPMLGDIKVFPGVEISVNPIVKSYRVKHPHVVGLGVSYDPKSLVAYEPLDDVLDYIKREGAVSVGVHAFDVTGAGLMKDSSRCDLIEGFNSNNRDKHSNLRAQLYALEKRKFVVSASDSHLPRTMGKATVTVYPRDMDRKDVGVEEIKYALRNGNFIVDRPSYNTLKDFKDMTLYHFSDREEVMSNLKKNPVIAPFVSLGEFFYKRFEKNPDAGWVDFFANIFEKRMTNLSEKVNAYGYPDSLIHGSSLIRKIAESLLPTMASRCEGGRESFERSKKFLAEYDHPAPDVPMNRQNDIVRGRTLEILN